MQRLIVFVIMIICFDLYGSESSDAFSVFVFDQKIKVIAPKHYVKGLNIIIQNRTLSKMIGKIETANGRRLSIMSIKKGASKSYELKMNNIKKLFYVPLSPPFQAVELTAGRSTYEIPSQ